MAITLRDTIKSTVKEHLLNNRGKAYGQCLTAVGWVGGTLPELYEEDGMVELSMADVAGGSIVVGAALAGDKPIYVVRYQGFQWYNCVSIINYAAKSKALWNRPCPVFVRSIAMEGAIGPVAGSSHHALYQRMPGLKIASPMTPKEYVQVYELFLSDDEPYYVSEHRKSFDNTEDLNDSVEYDNPDFTVFAISITRFEMDKLKKLSEEKGLKLNIFHILWLKPFQISDAQKSSLKNSKYGGMVIDDDYPEGSQSIIANYLSQASEKIVYPFGLKEVTAGFSPEVDNLPPTFTEIFEKLQEIKTLKDAN
jgi:pyruvate/2-oxoglutarate/acetoin dehydrogenase E1 component